MKKIAIAAIAIATLTLPSIKAHAWQETTDKNFYDWTFEQSSWQAKNNFVNLLNINDRAPASTPDLKWENAILTLNVNNNDFKYSSAIQVQQIMRWTEKEAFTDYRYEYVDKLQNSTCYKITCSGGTGKSEAWNRFYSAPKASKADALADAVKGIGKATAEKLVSGGYFNSKPRSWDEFAQEIRRAERSGIIQKGAATDILDTYRRENAANLGYNDQSCREEAYSCQKWVSVLEPVPFTNYRTKNYQKVADTRTFNINANIRGAQLLSHETEVLQFEVNENGGVNSDINGELNRYKYDISRDGSTIQINGQAIGRNLIDIPQNSISRDIFSLMNGKPTFAVEINNKYVPGSEDPESQLVLDYTVLICKRGFLGICGSYKNHKTAQSIFVGARAAVTFEDIPRGHKAYVSYTVSRRNSKFYNAKATRQRNSDSVTIR
ncbi:MAG: hypothetical protein M9962_09340 [Oligoflexia bacterium]|nr:hypothetical protein [Oligoflexia bacterium]